MGLAGAALCFFLDGRRRGAGSTAGAGVLGAGATAGDGAGMGGKCVCIVLRDRAHRDHHAQGQPAIHFHIS